MFLCLKYKCNLEDIKYTDYNWIYIWRFMSVIKFNTVECAIVNKAIFLLATASCN